MKHEDLKKLKEHLIHKIKELSESDDKTFNCENVTEVINSFDGVPTPPTKPPGSGTS